MKNIRTTKLAADIYNVECKICGWWQRHEILDVNDSATRVRGRAEQSAGLHLQLIHPSETAKPHDPRCRLVLEDAYGRTLEVWQEDPSDTTLSLNMYENSDLVRSFEINPAQQIQLRHLLAELRVDEEIKIGGSD